MRENKEECDRWNAEQSNKAVGVHGEEVSNDNPFAIRNNLTVIGRNADQVEPICKAFGERFGVTVHTDQACSDGQTMIINADLDLGTMAALINHENGHLTSSPRTSERCEEKRQTLFITNMSDDSPHKKTALQNNYIQSTWNPNWPGCGF